MDTDEYRDRLLREPVRQMCVGLRPSMVRRIDRIAAKRGVSRSEVIRFAINEFLKRVQV